MIVLSNNISTKYCRNSSNTSPIVQVLSHPFTNGTPVNNLEVDIIPSESDRVTDGVSVAARTSNTGNNKNRAKQVTHTVQRNTVSTSVHGNVGLLRPKLQRTRIRGCNR